MIIKQVTIKGFRSFGNNEQTLTLQHDKGQLILLVGVSGSGKTSLIKNFDYVLYGKVQGAKKRLPMSSLPNRINKELLSSITFTSSDTDILIKRGINPSVLELYENGNLFDRAGKSNLDDRIEKWIGMDLETFKSFISMSINDFKDFITLSTEEKKLLLDKLFNLESINIMNDCLKSLASENKKELDLLDREIFGYNQSLESIKTNIQKIKEKEEKDLSEEIEKIKEVALLKKVEWDKVKEKQSKISGKESELRGKIDSTRDEWSTINNEVKNTQNGLSLFLNGKCPTCQTDLNNDFHNGIKESYEGKLKSSLSIKEEVENRVRDLKEKESKLKQIKIDTDIVYNEITSSLRVSRSKIEELSKKSETVESDGLDKFLQTIKDIENKKNKTEEKNYTCKNRLLYHKELSKVFSEDGIKKIIIKNIISPINYFIAENMKKMNMSFSIVLDESFDAKVFQFGEEISSETLSTGEYNRCKIAILIAYLKLIRTKRYVNVLFLDEVFASIDVESIESVIGLMRDFANEYNINIFLVHHSILNSENFDRIIRINKEVFSNIQEVID